MQREEPDKVESPKAATPVSELKPLSNGDALEISFDLPGQKRKLDLDSIILNSPEHHKTSSSEEDEWLDVDTGGPASVSKVGYALLSFNEVHHELPSDNGMRHNMPKDLGMLIAVCSDAKSPHAFR